jgi:hypothetical protein
MKKVTACQVNNKKFIENLTGAKTMNEIYDATLLKSKQQVHLLEMRLNQLHATKTPAAVATTPAAPVVTQPSATSVFSPVAAPFVPPTAANLAVAAGPAAAAATLVPASVVVASVAAPEVAAAVAAPAPGKKDIPATGVEAKPMDPLAAMRARDFASACVVKRTLEISAAPTGKTLAAPVPEAMAAESPAKRTCVARPTPVGKALAERSAAALRWWGWRRLRHS